MMGLDQFLFRAKRYPNRNIQISGEDIETMSNYWYEKENNRPVSNAKKFYEYPLDIIHFYKSEYDDKSNDYGCFKEVGYWRKANAIHNWFVNKVQDSADDCLIHNECTPETLKELLDICKKIQGDNSLASQLLPTQGGFFFGDTDYNNWYFEWIDETIEILERILRVTDFETYAIYYQSSW